MWWVLTMLNSRTIRRIIFADFFLVFSFIQLGFFCFGICCLKKWVGRRRCQRINLCSYRLAGARMIIVDYKFWFSIPSAFLILWFLLVLLFSHGSAKQGQWKGNKKREEKKKKEERERDMPFNVQRL